MKTRITTGAEGKTTTTGFRGSRGKTMKTRITTGAEGKTTTTGVEGKNNNNRGQGENNNNRMRGFKGSGERQPKQNCYNGNDRIQGVKNGRGRVVSSHPPLGLRGGKGELLSYIT